MPSSIKGQGRLNSYLRYTSLGLQFVVTFALFVWIGHKIDGWAGSEIPWFLLLGGLLGASVATYKLYRTVFDTVDAQNEADELEGSRELQGSGEREGSDDSGPSDDREGSGGAGDLRDRSSATD